MISLKSRVLLIYVISFVRLFSAETSNPGETGDRLAILEARLAELEASLSEAEKSKDQNFNDAEMRIAELEVRLVEAEQKAKDAEQLATERASQTDRQLARKDNAVPGISGPKLLWAQEKQWDKIEPGVSKEKVIELLGPPPRSLDSLKPRVDEVFYYETSIRTSSAALFGKISFRKDEVLAVEKPDFELTESGSN